MAIDFLIFGLLLISFTINLLALGAFWVTPGLRTTANRFTINLLIINLIGCLILAPTLFLTGGGIYQSTAAGSSSSPLSVTTSDDSIEFYSKPGNHQMTIRHNGQLVEKEGVILRRNVTSSNDSDVASTDPRTVETIFKCNSTFCQQLTIDEGSDSIVITEIEEEEQQKQQEQPTIIPAPPPVTMRCWSIDLTAALGALAVLLVVGDTWCAVTDPLRYHSRISGVKTWVLIALTWVLGIFFGALSAFRELDFESESIFSKQKRYIATAVQHSISPWTSASWTSSSSLFSMIFACIYFVVVILLPFGFVCGMYWRIFSEARENGLRMRQNGSSPLLQSALNLNAQHQQQQSIQPAQYSNSLCVHRNSISSASSQGGGLQLSIDRQQKNSPVACHRRDSAAKVLLPTISDDSVASDDGGVVMDDIDSTHGQLLPVAEHPTNERNILLTLQAASGEIKRNYSARQLPLLGTSSQDFRETQRLQGIRQVHSSPNLQKYTQLRQDSLSDDSSCSPQLLGGHPVQQQRPHSHPAHRHTLHHHHVHLQHSHVLQIPAIHASPKALSYMSSLRHRLSNASSLFKYREESRAARISILVVIMFLVSYLPFGFLVLLQSRLSAANFAHSTQLAIFMLLLANLSSPFIFAYRNKRVRRGVKRLFGLDARSRDSQLQRHNSSSGRGSGFLQRHCGSNKSPANIKRTGSKVSTYSTNSCKHLTPQSSLVSNGGGVPPLRPNSSCSTIINFGAHNNNNNNSNNNNNTADVQQLNSKNNENENNTSSYLIANIIDEKSTTVLGITTRSARPLLQRGITIVEQIPLPLSSNKLTATDKRNIFKMFCHSSKSLSCAAAQSCAQGSADIEPAEV